MVMPIGILIIKCNNEFEIELIGKYPRNLNVDEELINKIYHSHLKDLSLPEIIHLNFSNCNALIFFSGNSENSFIIESYLIILLLKDSENPNKYREILFKITTDILNNMSVNFNNFDFFETIGN